MISLERFMCSDIKGGQVSDLRMKVCLGHKPVNTGITYLCRLVFIDVRRQQSTSLHARLETNACKKCCADIHINSYMKR